MIKSTTEEYNAHNIAVSFHDAESKKVVIFCHGFRGTSVGPARFFVRAAQKLEEAGISSLRFDQYGSGNSEGDFIDSSFNDWVSTATEIVQRYAADGYKVALFGQSMGGATVISVAAALPEVTSVVAWVPDPNIDTFTSEGSEYVEEGGQRVSTSYWQEAYDAKIADKLSLVSQQAYIVQCTADKYVNEANRKAIRDNSRAHHKVVAYEGYSHSNWTYEQSEEIITNSVDFIVSSFEQSS